MSGMQSQQPTRSYSLDFLKFVLTLLVFWWHTSEFVGENTRIKIPESLGFWSVHAFFVISGMLMVAHFYKKDFSDDTKRPVSKTVEYIKTRVKGISYEYYSAWLIAFVVYNICRYTCGSNASWFRDLVRSVPELLFLPMSGAWQNPQNRPEIFYSNVVTWYISAMLFVMILLYYILSRNPEFFCKIFAPVGALVSYSFMLHQDAPYLDWFSTSGLFTNGAIRGFCGLCFGVVAYDIYVYIAKKRSKIHCRILFTAAELLIYATIAYFWLVLKNSALVMFPLMLLLPVAVAVTFSGQSYSAELFRHKTFGKLAPLSLAIFLTHNATPVRLIRNYFSGKSYKMSVLLMVCFTIAMIVIYFVLIKLLKFCVKKGRVFLAEKQ